MPIATPVTTTTTTTSTVFDASSIATLKKYLRIDSNDEDDLIVAFGNAAVSYIENATGLKMLTQTLYQYSDTFPSGELRLNYGPVTSITSIKYYATSGGAEQTFSSASYTLDSTKLQSCVRLNTNYSWPSTSGDPNNITVTYVAGYANVAAIPEPLQLAIKLIVGHWYEHREAVVAGSLTRYLELAVDSIIAQYRIP